MSDDRKESEFDVTPDISGPAAAGSAWVKVGAAALLLVFGATMAYIVVEKNKPQDKSAEPGFVVQNSLPTDYYSVTEPEVFETPKEEATPEPAKKPVAKRKAKTKAKGGEAAQAAVAGQPRIQRVGGAGGDSQVLQFNAARRDAGATSVRVNRSFEYVNTQDSFDEAQDLASFPVNLDRTLTVDRNIPCILIEEIDSTLPGKVRCQVEHNVFAAHGRNILIPAGSKAVGFYKPLEKPGDRRLAVGWERIITPDGINIHTTDNRMADQMGRSGLTGDVDSRFWERYGMTLLITAISATTAIQVAKESNDQATAVAIQGAQQDLASVASAVLQENINLAPKVYIPAGSRIFMTPVVDIWFKKPERKVVRAVASPK